MKMHAAVVRSFDHPPRYEIYDTPEPGGPDETLVDVLAVGLHPRVRTDAAGRHYTSSGAVPMIPGIDGVGRLHDGQRVYFISPDDTWGSMADRARVDLRRTVPLSEGVDAVKVAAAMNPAMSSWVALRHRVPLQGGQSVLILGATGNAGARTGSPNCHVSEPTPSSPFRTTTTSPPHAWRARPPRWTSWSTTCGVDRRPSP
jgi:NADPH:quinone reductase-like Zn-dependent oxidoreductase